MIDSYALRLQEQDLVSIVTLCSHTFSLVSISQANMKLFNLSILLWNN